MAEIPEQGNFSLFFLFPVEKFGKNAIITIE